MTRGRLPQKGLDEALPVAMGRGTVMSIRQTKESVCDFTITAQDQVVLVRVRKAIRIHSLLEETEREFREPILRLRSFPGPGPVVRELWLYSRHGTWRFFRIEDAGIMEIGKDGTSLKNPFRVVARTVRGVCPKKTGAAMEKG
jgi:hypothetical protein